MGADKQATIAPGAQTPSKADEKLIRERRGGQVEGQDEKSLRGILGMPGCFFAVGLVLALLQGKMRMTPPSDAPKKIVGTIVGILAI